MVAIYCAGNHDAPARTETSFAGEALCPACKAIDDYCVLRTERCRSMAHKTSCEECGNHCYAPAEREPDSCHHALRRPPDDPPSPRGRHPPPAEEVEKSYRNPRKWRWKASRVATERWRLTGSCMPVESVAVLPSTHSR